MMKHRRVVSTGPAYGPVNNVATNTDASSVQPPAAAPSAGAASKEETTTVIYVLKAPFDLIGMQFLFGLLEHSKSNSVYNNIIKLIIEFVVSLDDSLLSKTHEFRTQFLNKVVEKTAAIAEKGEFSDQVKIQLEIQVNLIQELFSETEKGGGVELVQPHFSTIEGEYIKLKLENNLTGNDKHKKDPFILEVNENMTFWKLKEAVAEGFDEPVHKIDLIKYVYPIDEALNSKSVGDLHFFNEEVVKVQRKDVKPIPRHELLSENKRNLSERFDKIVQRWFEAYNREGVMTLEAWQQLSIDNWKGTVMKDEGRVKAIIEKYDTDKKGGLTLAQFKQHWVQASLDTNPLVWRILNLSGYLNNLKHSSEKEEKPETTKFGAESYPRKILSNKVFYKTLFTILSNERFQPVHLKMYQLLTNLETDHSLFKEIKENLKDFLENEKCIYKLSYGLESLINELEHDIELFADFFTQNGHLEIISKLENFFKDEEKSAYTLETSIKTIVIPNLLKIINLYAYPLNCRHRFVRFTKKNRINQLDVTEVAKKVDEKDSYAE